MPKAKTTKKATKEVFVAHICSQPEVTKIQPVDFADLNTLREKLNEVIAHINK